MERESVRRLALFDLDGTMIAGDSLVRFVGFVLHRVPRTRWQLPAMACGLLRSVGRSEAMKEAILAVIDPLSVGEQQHLAAEFVETIATTRVRPEAERLLGEQAAAGREPILVSASPDLYVVPLAARLGFQHVVATRLARREDGGWESRIEGENVKGPGKVTALLAHLGDQPVDWAGSFACGDRDSDRALLDRVGEPVAVHPDARLRMHARAQGWRIIP